MDKFIKIRFLADIIKYNLNFTNEKCFICLHRYNACTGYLFKKRFVCNSCKNKGFIEDINWIENGF